MRHSFVCPRRAVPADYPAPISSNRYQLIVELSSSILHIRKQGDKSEKMHSLKIQAIAAQKYLFD